MGELAKSVPFGSLSLWERAARSAGRGLQVYSNPETLTLPSPRGRGQSETFPGLRALATFGVDFLQLVKFGSQLPDALVSSLGGRIALI